MTAGNDTPRPPRVKPDRPAGSPLFFHATGRWAKKIRGRLVYFGRGSHADALAEYQAQAADLHAGRVPKGEDSGGLTVGRLCARFLTAKEAQLDAGELAERTFAAYGDTCTRLMRVLGKGRAVEDLGPADFAKLRKGMAETWGPVRLKAEMIRTRTPFNWAVKSGLIGRAPVYGEAFNPPTAAVIRRTKLAAGPRLFEADEVRRLIEAAGQPLRAMLYLGVNAGLGNSDVGALPMAGLDLAGGWLTFGRVKTGIGRRVPLWPETVAALQGWLAVRPEPKREADAGLVFLTVKRLPWSVANRSLSHEFEKLAKRAGVPAGRGFYALRHVFQTIGDESGDFIAVRKIMGHASNDIADVYRERVSDVRLRRVTDHVRGWLLGTG